MVIFRGDRIQNAAEFFTGDGSSSHRRQEMSYLKSSSELGSERKNGEAMCLEQGREEACDSDMMPPPPVALVAAATAARHRVRLCQRFSHVAWCGVGWGGAWSWMTALSLTETP